MIVFELACHAGHRFEGWFGSSEDFAQQQQRGLVSCPQCGSGVVNKAPMAPHLARKGNQLSGPAPEQTASAPVTAATAPAPAAAPSPPAAVPAHMREMLAAMVQLQAEALRNSRWVGKDFAEDARAMHYGEKDAETIHGQTTPDQARDLLEEGIAIMPVLIPLASPDEVN